MNVRRVVIAGLAVLAGVGGLFSGALSAGAAPAPVPVPPVVTSIPVLTWHELNNGCSAQSAVCSATDPESVSTAQLTAELAYLKTNNYHSVTAAQYLAWTQGKTVALPANPVLMVADNGIFNFLSGAQSVLRADGFLMNVAVVSGFADGASGVCPEPAYEPGCPADNNGWDATWSQLAALPSSNYDFIIEAGTAGHFVQTYDPNCTVFYACTIPGESTAAYEARVKADLSAGQSEITSHLKARFTAGLWVVPYSDAGYSACSQVGCVAQPSTGPAGWLAGWAALTYPVSFVEDSFRNAVQGERFRIDVQGWMNLTTFTSLLNGDLAAGDFSLTHTSPPVVPTPPPPPPTSTAPVAKIPVVSFDTSTVSEPGVSAVLNALVTMGYHSISSAQYRAWVAGTTPALPTMPVLLSFSGDNATVLASVGNDLWLDGYSAVDFVSSAAADAGVSESWTQLAALNPAVWTFSFASGAQGGTAVAGDPTTCNVYYACEAPGETDSAYQTRVANEIGVGRVELDNKLWMMTVDDFLWQPPAGDVGQGGVAYNGPAGWLSLWASWVFGVVFVPSGANGNHEHTDLVVNGATTQASFSAALSAGLNGGTLGD
jgi:hypothetical protein